MSEGGIEVPSPVLITFRNEIERFLQCADTVISLYDFGYYYYVFLKPFDVQILYKSRQFFRMSLY